jgi:hypothetical protein
MVQLLLTQQRGIPPRELENPGKTDECLLSHLQQPTIGPCHIEGLDLGTTKMTMNSILERVKLDVRY